MALPSYGHWNACGRDRARPTPYRGSKNQGGKGKQAEGKTSIYNTDPPPGSSWKPEPDESQWWYNQHQQHSFNDDNDVCHSPSMHSSSSSEKLPASSAVAGPVSDSATVKKYTTEERMVPPMPGASDVADSTQLPERKGVSPETMQQEKKSEFQESAH